MDVIANRMFGSLDTDKVLVLSFPSCHCEPIISIVTLVLVALDKVPAKHKVFCNVVHARTNDTHRNVVPWHPSVVSLGDFVVLPVINILEICNSIVVEILTRPYFVLDSTWVTASERVVSCVPAAEAKVKSSDERKIVVDDDELLVVCKVHGHVGSCARVSVACTDMATSLTILQNVVVWMSLNTHIGVQCFQNVLAMQRVAREGV